MCVFFLSFVLVQVGTLSSSHPSFGVCFLSDVSASARHSRAQCCAREFRCKILSVVRRVFFTDAVLPSLGLAICFLSFFLSASPVPSVVRRSFCCKILSFFETRFT